MDSFTESGLYARVDFGDERAPLRLTSLEWTGERPRVAEWSRQSGRTAEEAIVELADELTRLLRIMGRKAEGALDARGAMRTD